MELFNYTSQNTNGNKLDYNQISKYCDFISEFHSFAINN